MNSFMRLVLKALDTMFIALLVLLALGVLHAAGIDTHGILGIIRNGLAMFTGLF